jgi:hypothetical protein
MLGLNLVIFTVFKKGLNISNGQPEAVYRKKKKKKEKEKKRTNNTMDKRINNDLQNTTQKTED